MTVQVEMNEELAAFVEREIAAGRHPDAASALAALAAEAARVRIDAELRAMGFDPAEIRRRFAAHEKDQVEIGRPLAEVMRELRDHRQSGGR
jgi:Arc/MetJ-type ribon-helix-helix transcriptional regulator